MDTQTFDAITRLHIASIYINHYGLMLGFIIITLQFKYIRFHMVRIKPINGPSGAL